MKDLCVLLCVSGLVFISGCPKTNPRPDELADPNGLFGYSPTKAHIVGLTEFDYPQGSPTAVISAYVSLHDKFDTSIKAPGVFWFDLHEYLPRSSNRMGRNLQSWPPLDLSEAAVNNSHWEDFLRAYKFTLNTKIDTGMPESYVLQVSCRTPAGDMLKDIIYLKAGKH